jgi:hypothetical protein
MECLYPVAGRRRYGPRVRERGIAAWSSAAWRAEALAWVDAHVERTGVPEQAHLQPWATVLRVPTAGGPVWMKAAADATAFEAPLYALLTRVVPERVLAPLAVDVERAWLLLPDGGPSLGEQAAGPRALADALAEYARLQRALAPHSEDLLALGVPDMRPAVMPERYDQALEAVRAAGEEVDPRLEALRPQVAAWSERLAASPLPPSLDHNDLHPWNVLSGARFYDWGDSVVAHPFAALLVPLQVAGREGAAWVRDAYLEPFTDLAPLAELADTLALACRVATIARAHTWERALRSAREQGEPLEPRFARAPAETLAGLLEPG